MNLAMNLFSDTFSFFALLAHNDHLHALARRNFEYCAAHTIPDF